MPYAIIGTKMGRADPQNSAGKIFTVFLLAAFSISQSLCQSPAELVLNFETSSSYLAFTAWDGSTSGQLQFSFRTTEQDALLLYQADEKQDGDFLMLRFVDGHLLLDVRMQPTPEPGEDGHRNMSNVSAMSLADGEWHTILLERLNASRRRFKIRVDGKTWDNFKTGDGSLDTPGLTYFGGLPSDINAANFPMIQEVAATPNFVGCMKSIKFVDKDDAIQDPAPMVERQGVGLGTTCGVYDATCSVAGCENDGSCSKTRTGLCDCRGTNYTGALCRESKFVGTRTKKVLAIECFSKYVRPWRLKSQLVF